MEPQQLAELWEIYLDAGSPGGWFEEHERNEKGLKIALKYWGQNSEWLGEVEEAAFKALRPNNIGGIPQPQDPKDHPIIQDIKALQSENARKRASADRLRAALQAVADYHYTRYDEAHNDGYYQDGIEEGLRIAAQIATEALEHGRGEGAE